MLHEHGFFDAEHSGKTSELFEGHLGMMVAKQIKELLSMEEQTLGCLRAQLGSKKADNKKEIGEADGSRLEIIKEVKYVEDLKVLEGGEVAHHVKELIFVHPGF